VINTIRNNTALWTAFRLTALVVLVYLILPLLVAWIGAFVPGCIAAAQKGIAILEVPEAEKYLHNLEGFWGQLTLLTGSGLLALWVWSRRGDLHFFGGAQGWLEILIGISFGILNYYCDKQLIVPWLYMARPSGLEWINSQYHSVTAYGPTYIDQIASVFFVGSFYVPVIETIVFVGLMYRRFRSQWGFIASILLCSIIFAFVHQNLALFLEFFLFASANLALYEFRKSLAAPLLHHVTLNVMIYGSQLALFSGFSSK
jgi:membrane protease YdiL (CAAX protease family)